MPRKIIADCIPSRTSVAPPPIPARARAVRAFRALGDPTRFDVFALIASRPEPVCVCDITARFEVSQPTISHHLRILREAGLVTASRRGVWSYYAVDPRGAKAARAAIDALVPGEAVVPA